MMGHRIYDQAMTDPDRAPATPNAWDDLKERIERAQLHGIDPNTLLADGHRIYHVDGRTWADEAPIPPWLHRCRPWTTVGDAQRCACGAISMVGRHRWVGRNIRRLRQFLKRNS